jgi:hypothetical protein
MSLLRRTVLQDGPSDCRLHSRTTKHGTILSFRSHAGKRADSKGFLRSADAGWVPAQVSSPTRAPPNFPGCWRWASPTVFLLLAASRNALLLEYHGLAGAVRLTMRAEVTPRRLAIEAGPEPRRGDAWESQGKPSNGC